MQFLLYTAGVIAFFVGLDWLLGYLFAADPDEENWG